LLIDHHRDRSPILEYFRINAAVREALRPRVDLPSGGYVIIQPTEALTVIDVNSGSFTRSATARETVLWTNCEAAAEIARQLRLRNIAGVIVVDFIDMESRRDQMQVLEHFNKALKADKLIFLSHESLDLPQKLTLDEAQAYQHELLSSAIEALEAGIERIHLLNAKTDGALLLELYTRDGVGSMISAKEFECLRAANIEDINSILDLIRPLEQAGILVKRSREHLEMEINNFHVITRDQKVIACVALYNTDNPQVAELACFAVDPKYRGGKRGDKLLEYIIQLAHKQGKTQLLALTTQTIDWFQEHGFRKGSVEELPKNKKSLYNYKRNSHILFKYIAE